MKYVLKEQWLNTMNYEPSEYLQFLDGCIATCKEKLLMFAAATPRMARDDAGTEMEWEDYVQFEIGKIMDELDEYMNDRRLCSIVVDCPDSVEKIED